MIPDLTSLQWLVLVFMTLQWLSVAVQIMVIGKPRKPLTPGVAISSLVLAAFFTAWAISAW